MKRLIAVMITVVLLFGTIAPVIAKTIEEIFAEKNYLSNQVNMLRAAGKMSNDEAYSVYIDLSQVPEYGSVTATVYKTASELKTATTFTNIKKQSLAGANGANDKVVRYYFYLDNNDDSVVASQIGYMPDDTVWGFVYGESKTQMLGAFIAGLPECLEKQRLYDNPTGGSSGGGSSSTAKTTSVTTENSDSWAEKYLTSTFTVNDTTYKSIASTGTITLNDTIAPTVQKMDTVPYIKEGRTYVPVRYLAYALGVTENGVTWNSNTRKVGINKNDTDIALIIGSPVMQINQKPIKMDVAPEIKNGRTMLPARWIAEALGAEVTWNETTKTATIKMPIKPGD